MSSETDPRIMAIITLYQTKGNSHYYGEKVSKTDHMIQAAISAQKAREADEVVLACLLHDIGHFLEEDDMDGLGVRDHGRIGAQYLRSLGMDEYVCALVENHAEAKRYLVSARKDYYTGLSEASKQTLVHQGGRMTKDECRAFEKQPYFHDVLKVRHHDDAGKREGIACHGLEGFIPLIRRHFFS